MKNLDFGKVCYISGPITKDKKSFYRFEAWQKYINGYEFPTRAINPFHICRNDVDNSKSYTWKDFMSSDLELLIAKCDTAIFLPGWLWSKGSRIEFINCLLFGIRCVIITKSMIKYINKRSSVYVW